MKYKNKLEIKLENIRWESLRIWDYLKEMIDFIENKYYLYEIFDINELLAYSKSCKESYENIQILTHELEQELEELKNE